jgi:hypothetical protein
MIADNCRDEGKGEIFGFTRSWDLCLAWNVFFKMIGLTNVSQAPSVQWQKPNNLQSQAHLPRMEPDPSLEKYRQLTDSDNAFSFTSGRTAKQRHWVFSSVVPVDRDQSCKSDCRVWILYPLLPIT